MSFKEIALNAWNWAVNTRLKIGKKDEQFANLPIIYIIGATVISWQLVLASAVLVLVCGCKVNLDSSKSRQYSENLKSQYGEFQKQQSAQKAEYEAQKAAKKAEQAAQYAAANSNEWHEAAQQQQPQQAQPMYTVPPTIEQQPFPPRADEIKLTIDPSNDK